MTARRDVIGAAYPQRGFSRRHMPYQRDALTTVATEINALTAIPVKVIVVTKCDCNPAASL
jgi:hypothetical protein